MKSSLDVPEIPSTMREVAATWDKPDGSTLECKSPSAGVELTTAHSSKQSIVGRTHVEDVYRLIDFTEYA